MWTRHVKDKLMQQLADQDAAFVVIAAWDMEGQVDSTKQY